MIRFVWTITMALALTAGIAAIALFEAEELLPWGDHIGASIGEVLLDDGMRAEAAGQTDAAEQLYLQSLNARFEGPQNRKMALFKLGCLVGRKPGATDRAIAYLEEAVEGETLAERDSEALREAYEALESQYEAREGLERQSGGRAESGPTP